MRIIDQSYEILSPNPQNPAAWRNMLALVETAGRTCYKSDPAVTPEPFVRRIVHAGHHSVIEHANLTVRFITDRGVTHELVRHRLAAYSQESTRYCDYGGDDIAFVRPVWSKENGNQHWTNAMLAAEVYYKTLRQDGWSPQQARAVLPNSLKTEIVMTANLREWRHVLDLRCGKAAHPQIRELMLPLRSELAAHLPAVFEGTE